LAYQQTVQYIIHTGLCRVCWY